MDIFQTLALSVVEGITEFLPVSSTGHLILTSQILGIIPTDFTKSFEIAIQLGAISSILVLYLKRLSQNWRLWTKILTAFIPSAVVGFIFFGFIKDFLLESSEVTLLALFAGGIFLILFEKVYKSEKHIAIKNLTHREALVIGIFQSFSVIPGVSRAAASIIGGLSVGLARAEAVEFSFFLAVPTIFAATALDLGKSNFSFASNELTLLITGFIGAFLTAFVVIQYFLNFIKKHTFIPFGVYRIVLAVIYWLILIR